MGHKEFSELFTISDGSLLRRMAAGTRGLHGVPVGGMVKGYLRFEHKEVTYAVHNVIWMIYNQKGIPDGFIVDHEDGNPLNNNPSNLRLATRTQNCYNSKLYSNNTSGYKGVSFDKDSGKWLAQIRIDGKNKKLGRYATAELANEAVVASRIKNHKEFANHGND